MPEKTITPITIIIDGTPVPKQSYRSVKGGGYTDPRVKAWQTLVSTRAREVMQDREPIHKNIPVAVRIVFVLKYKRRVDIDNLSKGTLDGLNGIVFDDDTQITNLHLVKHVIPNAQPGAFVQVYPGGPLPLLADADDMRKVGIEVL